MLVEDQALDLRVAPRRPRARCLGEREARHDVGHDAHAAAVDLGAERRAVRLVDQAQHRVGVGVVDEVVRQEGVQQRLDRRVRRHRIDQVGALHAHHVLVATARRGARSLRSGASRTAGRPAGSIVAMSQPEPLTHSTSACSPSRSGSARLDRGVAAAVQHEHRIVAEQARGVDAQRQIGRDALVGITGDQRLGVTIDVAAAHATSLTACPAC